MRFAQPHHHHHHCQPRQARGGFGPGGPDFGPGFGGPGGPGGFGGFGFGGPGGFGGGPRGRGPGGPGGRRRRGDVRLGLLLLLREDGPANGYGLIQGLSERSEGAWTPSPGSVYPTLAQLEDEGLIAGRPTENSSGTTYALTDTGREYLDGLGDVKAPWEDSVDKGHPAYQFRRTIGGLVKAAVQVVQDGDPKKIEQALELLNGTRRELYRLLAEDEA